jgi:biphenyl-2,3-diol 1,2-dioxygenase
VFDLQFGYLGVTTTVRAEAARFLTDVLGLREIPGEDARRSRLRLDERSWRLSLEDGGNDDILYLGFDAPNRRTLAERVTRLRSSGFDVQSAPGELVTQRGLSELAIATDPDGLQVELAYGANVPTGPPFVARHGLQYVTGALGLGHVVLATPDIRACLRFYEDGLGFRTTDTADIPSESGDSRRVHFMHCNSRHHSLALVEAVQPRRMRHLMLELANVDQVGMAFDRSHARGALTRGFGRHTNDQALSFYLQAPGGVEIEIACDGRTVDDATWTVHHYVGRPSTWGHQLIKNATLVGGPR